MKNKKGYVLWVTGLSGAGKTTVATGVVSALEKLNTPVTLLDGDNLRDIFASKWGYSISERKELALVYAKLCQHLSNNGVNVICSTVAMFDDVREWNRENIENYIEIYLRVPVDVLMERDSKGLYEKYKTDNSDDNKVILDEFELPQKPDIVIDNYADCSAQEAEWKIINFFMQKLIYGTTDSDKKVVNIDIKKGIVSYWDKIYVNKQIPSSPTSFAKLCIEKYISKNSLILEFGCGNARDTNFFAKNNKVIAIDTSKIVIQKNIEKIKNSELEHKIHFISGYFGDVQLPSGTKVDVVYSRFVMHAMNEESEDRALKEAYNILNSNGLLLLEFRTTRDSLSELGFSIGNHEKVTDHYRRFIETKNFKEKLIKIGFNIKYFIEKQGLAKLGDDDPVVARIVAKK